MADAAIAADLDEALDAAVDLAAQIAFDAEVAFDNLAQAGRVLLGQVAHLERRG